MTKFFLPMNKIPEDGTLENENKMSFRDSEQLKSTLALKTQDTMQRKEQPSCTRLIDTLRRFLDQTMKDRSFDLRRDDKTAQRSRGKKKTRRLLSMAL